MKNYQYAIKDNMLNMILSSDVFSAFYKFANEHTRKSIVLGLVGTPGVPIIYRTVDELSDGLSDLTTSANIHNVLVVCPNAGRLNYDDAFVTYMGIIYNRDQIATMLSKDCIVVPIIGLRTYDSVTETAVRTEVEIGEELLQSVRNSDNSNYYIRALLIVDLATSGSVAPANMPWLKPYVLKQTIKEIRQQTEPVITYHERKGVGMYLLNGELMDHEVDIPGYEAECMAAKEAWERSNQ